MPAGTGVCPACHSENSLVIKRGTDSVWICLLCGWDSESQKKPPRKTVNKKREGGR